MTSTCLKFLCSTLPLPASPPPAYPKATESAGALSMVIGMVSLPWSWSLPPVLVLMHNSQPQRGFPQFFPRRVHDHPSWLRHRRQQDSSEHGEQPRTLREMMFSFPWRVRTSVKKSWTSLRLSAASSARCWWPTHLVQ